MKYIIESTTGSFHAHREHAYTTEEIHAWIEKEYPVRGLALDIDGRTVQLQAFLMAKLSLPLIVTNWDMTE
jgi:hypothetical protein